MPFLSLDIQEPATSSQPPPLQMIPFTLSSASLSRGAWPGRGLLYSFLIHEVAVFGILLLTAFHGLLGKDLPPIPVQMIDLSAQRKVLYLPALGLEGERGGRKGAGKPGASRSGAAVAQGRRTRGLSYPGPQPVVSDVPNPTNRIQTILQPALEKPPILPPLISLPNLVQMADAGPAPMYDPPPLPIVPVTVKPAPVPPIVKPEIKPAAPVPPSTPPTAPSLQLPAPAPIEQPKLIIASTDVPSPLPPPVPVKVLPKPVQQAQPAPKPAAPKAAPAPIEPPKLDRIASVPTRGPDLQNLLALSPMPAPPEQSVKVPAGEARGRFAISPEPNLAASGTAPGANDESTPAPPVGVGKQQPALPGNAAAEGAGRAAASGREIAMGRTADDGGSGSGGNTGLAKGLGNGTGAGTGTGAGAAAGTGTGTSAGPGAAGAKNPFSGITIQGGRLETGKAGDSASRNISLPRAPALAQGSYGMTIVSTAGSGGGLPDFGVFSHEQVYTVYLDMRRTTNAPAPSWILQYAVVRGTAAGTSATQSASQNQQGLVPPFPMLKEPPDLPVDLVRRYPQRLVVVYAIINPEGKMEQLAVKQSPDPRLNEPVLAALSKWAFRPAELNGQPIAVKILLGIPLSLSE